MEDTLEKQGTTKERMRHSKIAPRIAQISEGGIIEVIGQMDTEHCYLDFLKNNDLLGEEPDATTRYDTGYKLRDLYFSFHQSAACAIKEPGSFNKVDFTTEEDTPADKAEAEYNRVVRAIPTKYREILLRACLEYVAPQRSSLGYHNFLIEGLDALYGAFKR